METFIEYRVRPVTRYIVTRFEQKRSEAYGTATDGLSRQIGKEFDNSETAYEVGYALARAEHERLGYSLGDERVKYPYREDISATTAAA